MAIGHQVHYRWYSRGFLQAAVSETLIVGPNIVCTTIPGQSTPLLGLVGRNGVCNAMHTLTPQVGVQIDPSRADVGYCVTRPLCPMACRAVRQIEAMTTLDGARKHIPKPPPSLVPMLTGQSNLGEVLHIAGGHLRLSGPVCHHDDAAMSQRPVTFQQGLWTGSSSLERHNPPRCAHCLFLPL